MMKYRIPSLCVVMVPLFMLWMGHQMVLAQDHPEPSAHHKILKQDVGTWNVECKMWPSRAADPIAFQAEEKNRLLATGLWMISDFKVNTEKLKFEGHGVIGYDPYQEKYVGGWVDSMNPSPSLMEGTYDAEKKTMTMYSETRDPETGKVVKSKNITRYKDDGTREFEMYMIEDGSEWKVMEGHYTKKQ